MLATITTLLDYASILQVASFYLIGIKLSSMRSAQLCEFDLVMTIIDCYMQTRVPIQIHKCRESNDSAYCS